jgi:catechol 2,3-dioxygenase-like lactoylglutathione lyase family enzyme
MAISAMSHFTVLTDDVPRTVHFYCNLLGLSEGDRPNLGFPGRGSMPVTRRSSI